MFFELSLMGSLAAFKMLHLPQILYLFRTLPNNVPASYFKSQQTMLSSFTWQGKKARCTHTKLVQHCTASGTGYKGFQDYYMASVLTQLKEWFLPSASTIWG